MSTLARLYFRIHPVHLDAFNAGYKSHLAPILQRHGILPGLDVDRPIANAEKILHANVFSVIFAVEGPGEIAAWASRLHADPEWQCAIDKMGATIHRYELGLFRASAGSGYTTPIGSGTTTPAGPGTTTKIGSGFWQGLWQRYGLLDGLPASISDIVQHPNGDLFLATREYATNLGRGDGLWRLDGVNLQRWGTDDGLPSDQVICLCIDEQGQLWIGSEDGGLTRYDGSTFTTYTTADGLPDNVIGALQINRTGQLWIGTPGGLCRYDGTTITTFGKADGLPLDKIARLFEDREGRLWFGAGWSTSSTIGWGLGCFDGETFTRYTEAEGLPMNWILSLAADPSGALWFGQSDCLGRFDGEQFEWVFSTDMTDHLGGVTALIADQTGQLFFSSWGEGLKHYDGSKLSVFTPEDGLTGINILSLLQDRDGQLWVGTLGAGLSRYNGQQLTIFGREDGPAHQSIHSLAADRQGDLWISTSRGMNIYEDHQFTLLAGSESSIGRLLHDDRNRLWFSRPSEGVCCWDGQRTETILLPNYPSNSATDQTVPLLQNSSGELFFAVGGQQGNLCLLDENGSEKTLVPFATDLGIDPRSIRCMIEDHQGGLWFGGSQELVQLHNGQVRHFSTADGLPESPITALLQDRQGHLWIATGGGGLCRWNSREMTCFNTTNGLSHNEATALLEDANGHLWIATAGGVSRYDGQVFQHLSRRDGLPDDSIRALHQDASEAVWIGTGNGLVRYRPVLHPPTIRLTTLVADRHYAPDETIAVATSQQLITLTFQGFSLSTPPDRLAYCCRLKDRDTSWQPLYTNRIEYRNLPEGDYLFEVRAIDRDFNYSEIAQLRFSIEPDAHRQSLEAALAASGPQGEFVGQGPALQEVQRQLQQVAPAELTVLILGETGSGKGLAARTLHQYSPRANGPFILVNCGAIPEALIEAELFGHEKGAYTGATARRLGKVELAQNGTLFLDEIGDLPLVAQVKFLRLLEERTFERVGGTQEMATEVRVVAATNRDLRQMVAAGTFREDLYFRLQGFEVQLPPLRARREDIPLLALYFIGPKAAHLDKQVEGLSKTAEAALVAHDWPGNVRELQHTIERAVVVCQGPIIEIGDLMLSQTSGAVASEDRLATLEEMERRHIQTALEITAGRVSGPQGAATLLGLHDSTLRARMRKLGIKRH